MEVTPNHPASLPNRASAAPLAPAINDSAWNAPAGAAGVAASGAAVIAPGSTLTSLLPMGDPSPLFRAGLPARGDKLSAQEKRPAGETAVGSVAESKRLKRLEKNRESARECRRRKKENKERVEAQLASLEEENLNLRLQLKVGDEAEDAENCEILEIKKSLHDLVSRGVDEGEILQTMDLLTDRFADYGSAHTSAADFHLAQLSRLLLPTLTTRVCMHAVLQAGGGGGGGRADARIEGVVGTPDVSSTAPERRPRPSDGDGAPGAAERGVGNDVTVPPSDCVARAPSDNLSQLPAVQAGAGTAEGQKKGDAGVEGDSAVDMWSSLVAVLEATGEQQAVMRNQVGAIAELARDLEGTTQIMERLKLLLADRNQTLDEEMAAIQRILTPTQSAKFVLWVSKNKACVHMLNQLWEKLHGGEPAGGT